MLDFPQCRCFCIINYCLILSTLPTVCGELESGWSVTCSQFQGLACLVVHTAAYHKSASSNRKFFRHCWWYLAENKQRITMRKALFYVRHIKINKKSRKAHTLACSLILFIIYIDFFKSSHKFPSRKCRSADLLQL